MDCGENYHRMKSFTFYLKGKAIVHGFWLKISRNEKF